MPETLVLPFINTVTFADGACEARSRREEESILDGNWLLLQGLRHYGFQERAENVKRDIITLIERCGFHEYCDPYPGFGYGTDNFSRTAALFIDIALEKMEAGNH